MIQFFCVFLFFSLNAFSANKKPVQDPPAKRTIEQDSDQTENSLDFVPSLSDTLSNTNRLKKQMKQQVAENITKKPQEENLKQQNTKRTLSRETAHFGDLEVSISERTEEELTEFQNEKKSH